MSLFHLLGGVILSIITYIGLNFEVEVTEEITDEPVQFSYGCAEDDEYQLAVKEKQFTTQFVYQIMDTDDPFWAMHEYNLQYSPHNFEKAKKTFNQLCAFLNELLPEGDYCEIFVCWLGDENEPMAVKRIIDLKNPILEPLEHYENCYIKFYKS